MIGVFSDKRINLITDIINGIKTIKAYRWERIMERKVRKYRDLQLKNIKSYYIFISIGSVVLFSSGYIFVLVVLLYHWGTERKLEYSSSVVLMSVGTYLSLSVIVVFLNGFAITLKIQSIFRRVNEVLNTKDKQINDELKDDNTIADNIVWLYNVTGTWGFQIKQDIYSGKFEVVTDEPTNNLINITLEAERQDFIAVIGPVGWGKTTLFNAIMNELEILKGDVKVYGTVSYVEQEPFITSDTVKGNILFGQEYDKDKLDLAIRVWWLGEDIRQLKEGLETKIGEKGINISGGQKARISLARAIYSDADIYLLDDPLSALDQRVGTEIYNRCIRGYLKDKCVILATHQVHLLEDAEKILVMDEGRIIERGTYSQINGTRNVEEDKEDEDSDSIVNSSDSSVVMLKDIMLKNNHRATSRIVSLSMPKKSSVNLSIQARRGIREISTSMAIKLERSASTISLLESSEDKEYIDKPASIKDLFKLYSFGVGNFWFILMIVSGFISSFSIMVCYYLIGKLAEKDKDDQQDSNLIYWIICALASIIIFQVIGVILIHAVIFTASRKIHNIMVWSLLRTNLSFFDQNTIGTILTKFTKDISGLDVYMPNFTFVTVRLVTLMIAIITTILIATPFLIVIIAIWIFMLYLVRKVNRLPSQKLEWLESEARGPLNTRFSSVLDGLMTIRAYKKEEYFMHKYYDDSDVVASVALSRSGVNNWFRISLDFIGIILIFFTTLFVFVMKLYTDWIDDNFLAIAITSCATFITGFNTIGKSYNELENQLKILKNAMAYTELKSEGELETKNDPVEWPKSGIVRFENVQMKYSGADRLALNNMNCLIKSLEKVGIKGRTGSGKSSIISTLFRFYPIKSGAIKIDGQDINKIGLHWLRNGISYIAQTPFLMIGTLKENLDPFKEYTDDEIQNALKDVQMLDYVNILKDGIDTEITAGSVIFSAGQKQLICLARAILEKAKILSTNFDLLCIFV